MNKEEQIQNLVDDKANSRLVLATALVETESKLHDVGAQLKAEKEISDKLSDEIDELQPIVSPVDTLKLAELLFVKYQTATGGTESWEDRDLEDQQPWTDMAAMVIRMQSESTQGTQSEPDGPQVEAEASDTIGDRSHIRDRHRASERDLNNRQLRRLQSNTKKQQFPAE